MRFPALTDLDREQRRIYAEAPNDGAILIVGAPGTGKTIMAFHRAQKLRELGQSPHVIMFGSVLMNYTSGGSHPAKSIPVSTMHNWSMSWWSKAFKRTPPRQVDSRFDIDWAAVCSEGLCARGDVSLALDWGHLIIDEGQDFPSEMYIALGMLARGVGDKESRPRITVFADDNQRLQVDKNSETAGIRKNLFIAKDEKRNYTLKKNFRNSYEVARLAVYFQVGQASGQPEMPDRHGDLPSVLLSANHYDLSEFIARKVKSSPGKQVGVIINGPASDVKRTYNRLAERLKDTKIKVQMYTNADKEKWPAKNLDFESLDTVTILHRNSAKGLEFDIVFFIGLQRTDLDASGGINERMALYVICSRSRFELFLAFSELDRKAKMPAAIAILPPPDAKLCNYVGLGAFADCVDEALTGIQWLIPTPDPGKELE